jgi:hypothetical protein
MFLKAAAILDALPHPRADEVHLKLRDLDSDAEPETEAEAEAATQVR